MNAFRFSCRLPEIRNAFYLLGAFHPLGTLYFMIPENRKKTEGGVLAQRTGAFRESRRHLRAQSQLSSPKQSFKQGQATRKD
jgi:hypothetical protein